MKWLKELQKCAADVCKIFVGNKTDMRNPSNPEHITYERAHDELTKLRIPYFECSALTRKGLEELFSETVKAVLESKKII